MKNKTLAAWLTFLGGPLGLHRFYLRGLGDTLGWALPIPTALGLYGIGRAKEFGLDDVWAPALIPLLGFTVAGCALTAIVYGLMTPEKWNAKFNPAESAHSMSGSTNWLTIGAVVVSLFVGATSLVSSIVYSFQNYFEHQMEEAHKISR
jgi:hypothetical protein